MLYLGKNLYLRNLGILTRKYSVIFRVTLEVFHACRSSLLVLYKSIFSFEFIIFLYFLIFVLFCDLNSIPANCPFQTLSSSIIILQVLFFWSLLHKIRGRKTDLLKDCLKIFNVLIVFLWAALPYHVCIPPGNSRLRQCSEITMGFCRQIDM